jgi:hypothetical protein
MIYMNYDAEEEEENLEMRASVWVAQRPVKLVLSLQEDGTYFQFFNLKRSRVAIVVLLV